MVLGCFPGHLFISWPLPANKMAVTLYPDFFFFLVYAYSILIKYVCINWTFSLLHHLETVCAFHQTCAWLRAGGWSSHLGPAAVVSQSSRHREALRKALCAERVGVSGRVFPPVNRRWPTCPAHFRLSNRNSRRPQMLPATPETKSCLMTLKTDFENC